MKVLIGVGIGTAIALSAATPALADHGDGDINYGVTTCISNCQPDPPAFVKQNNSPDAFVQQILTALETINP